MRARILVADDCPMVRSAVVGVLEREGHTVIGVAGDGAEAVRLAQQLCPDVAILDLSMPHLDGLGAAREIRRECPATRLVLLTAHNSEDHIAVALSAGFDAFVAKSDASDDLGRAVREVMGGGRFLSLKPSRLLLGGLLHDRGPA